ncbi:MAG TPA: hypothetical protein PKZ66_02225, partial [Chitinophagaceae bacterium]|nr:hypothetical protein [Chitinophagaceae bacterium]
KQDKEDKMQKREEMVLEKMKENLNLSDDQVTKIKTINETYAKKAQAVRNDKNLSQEQKKQALLAIAKERKEAIGNTLTTEQKEKQKNLRNRD